MFKYTVEWKLTKSCLGMLEELLPYKDLGYGSVEVYADNKKDAVDVAEAYLITNKIIVCDDEVSCFVRDRVSNSGARLSWYDDYGTDFKRFYMSAKDAKLNAEIMSSWMEYDSKK